MSLLRRSLLVTVAALLAGAAAACGASSDGAPSPGGDAGAGDAAEPSTDAGDDADASVADAGDEDATGVADAADAADAPAQPVVIPKLLSQLGLFLGGPDASGALTPAPGNLPYDLSTPLFSDYAQKRRTVRVPAGARAHYVADEALDFPIGTILSKTFAFAADLREPDQNVRLVETRILVRQPSGWEAWPYLWSQDQSDATLAPGGRVVPVSFVDAAGGPVAFDYLVPSKNQCEECHHQLDAQGQRVMVPIGPKARYLHHARDYGGSSEDQLAHMAALGILDGLPAASAIPRAPNAFDPASGTLDERARTYLDINCAHCHNPRGTAGITSQLFLNVQGTSSFNLGICKRPGSAGSDVGGTFDIVPGAHDQSILWYRMTSTESGKMMPLIGRALTDAAGSQLVADWIDSMQSQSCQ